MGAGAVQEHDLLALRRSDPGLASLLLFVSLESLDPIEWELAHPAERVGWLARLVGDAIAAAPHPPAWLGLVMATEPPVRDGALRAHAERLHGSSWEEEPRSELPIPSALRAALGVLPREGQLLLPEAPIERYQALVALAQLARDIENASRGLLAVSQATTPVWTAFFAGQLMLRGPARGDIGRLSRLVRAHPELLSWFS